MYSAITSSSFVLPLIAAVSLAASGARVQGGDAVEMEVLGVLPIDSDSASVLVLRQKGGRTVLPIFVGRTEGAAVETRLKHTPAHWPHGADLLAETIAALGGKVTRVQIEGAQAALFTARISVQQGNRSVAVEARPSDSVALAVASHAPIFASRALVAAAGFTDEDLARARRSSKRRNGDGDGRLGPVQSF